MKRRTTARVLDPAERARTLVATAVDIRVGVFNSEHEIGRHAVTGDGSLLFLPPADAPRVFDVAKVLPPDAITVTIIDVASVPQHDRVRGTLRLTGRLGVAPVPLPVGVRGHLAGPDPDALENAGQVVELRPTRVQLAWRCEREDAGGSPWVEIPVDSYRAAFPDAVMAYESQWLPHLQVDHAELLRALAAQEYGELDDSVDVRPLGLDRFGLVVRLYGSGAHLDVRLPFARPVTCGCEIRDAFNGLLTEVSPQTPGFTC